MTAKEIYCKIHANVCSWNPCLIFYL